MKRHRHIRYQRRVVGGRAAVPTFLLHAIEHALDTLAKKYNVSRSFVAATLLADYLAIEGQEDFRVPPETPGRPRRPGPSRYTPTQDSHV